MKNYRNELHGFEVNIPDEWSPLTSVGTDGSLGKNRMVIFRCGSNGAFNIQITPLTQKPFLYQTENEFRQDAEEDGYTSLELGRFNADGEEHVWARYYVGYGKWVKKYRIALHEFEYLITARCRDQKELLQMEKTWDEIASSFYLIRDRADAKNDALRQKTKIQVEPVIGNDAKKEILSKVNIQGVKTYRSEELGIELEVPGRWKLPEKEPLLGPSGAEIIFGCGINEAFYIIVKESTEKLTAEQTKLRFKEYALEKGYSNLKFGKFALANDKFVWVTYYMGDNIWVKKYLIFLNNVNYEISASCTDTSGNRNLFDQKCKGWDLIVKLFRILHPPTDEIFRYGPMGRFDVQPVADSMANDRKNELLRMMAGMKTYRNEKHGFEIDIPDNWSPPPAEIDEYLNTLYPVPPGLQKDVFQYGCFDEAFNFEIAPLFPEPLPDDTEVEFRLYARDRGFKDLRFGRIMVAGKEHVCASYFIHDEMGVRWNKKYMVVFGGVEYAITGTCNDPHWFAKREKDWDSIIQTFRVLKPFDDSLNYTDKAERHRDKRREVVQERIEMRNALGDLYARAYEAVSMGNYREAQLLLERCLQENPNHVLAHKELAVVLEKLGDRKGAIAHRREVKRLDPSDEVNRSKLERLLAGSGSGIESPEKGIPVPPIGGLYYRNPTSQPSPNILDSAGDESKRSYTLAFSIRSYLLITVFSALYIHLKVGLKVFLALTSDAHQPLSNSEFNLLSVILVFGIGAFVCLMFLLGVATIGQSAEGESFFNFIGRTMRKRDKQKETIGEKVFSDFTRTPNRFLDGVNLQVGSLVHALTKVFSIPFSIGLVNRVMLLIFALCLIMPQFIHYPMPISWIVIYFTFYYYFCYRALLFHVARLKGVSRATDLTQSIELAANLPLASSIQSARTRSITPGFIAEILNQEGIVNTIKNDLRKMDQIGYKEVWRLGLITPDQDMYDFRLFQLPKSEGMKRLLEDSNFRFTVNSQIPLKRTAVLHSTSYFNTQFNNVLITNGTIKHLRYPGWNYHLRTALNKGEYMRIRNIQIDTSRPFAENRSQSVVKFLREDGFPIKEFYVDGDPLITERGGVIVIDKDRVLVTYPKYLTQRRLIDDEGNLVDIGIDEGTSLGGVIEVKMQPAVLNSIVRYASSNGYIPILRYHSIPYTSEFMLPILDTPISISGWAELFIDTNGKGRLFITKEKTLTEWYEMMARLKQLFYDELARKDYHLLGLTKDKTHLNYYLSKKLEILKDYYIVQDWKLF